MNILIVANHYAVCSARYATDAFTRLGHTVRHVGPEKGRDIWGLTLPPEFVWEPEHDIAFKPDFTIVMDSDPQLLDHVQTAPGLKVIWGVDNHVRDYRRAWFDHYFLAHKSVSKIPWLSMPASPDDKTMLYGFYPEETTWLPCAYDPTIFTPSTIPWAEREYDVCMIGVMYPQRWQLVEAMRAAGLKVFAGTGLVGVDCAKAYQNARVSLCASAAGDLGQRVFETAACGCIVLTDPLADLGLLDPYAPVCNYRTPESAVSLAVALQSQGGNSMGGAYWAEEHTWDARAQVIVDWYNNRVSEGAR